MLALFWENIASTIFICSLYVVTSGIHPKPIKSIYCQATSGSHQLNLQIPT
jgi:hypothetical protein